MASTEETYSHPNEGSKGLLEFRRIVKRVMFMNRMASGFNFLVIGQDIDLNEEPAQDNDTTLGQLNRAVFVNDVATTEQLLTKLEEEGEDVNAVDGFGRTPLHWAACGGGLEAAKLLVSKGGASVGPQDKVRWTPLHLASLHGQLPLVKFLLSELADPLAGDRDGWTPLHWAASQDHVKVVETLTKVLADPSVLPIDDTMRTPLHVAAGNGKMGSLKWYAESGVDLNVEDLEGRTPIHYTVGGDHLDAVEVLIDGGCLPDSIDKGGGSALHYAAFLSKTHFVARMVELGAAVNVSDGQGACPMHWVVEKGDIDTVKALKSAGGDVNRQDSKGKTPLHWAVEQAEVRLEIINAFIDSGADVNLKDEDERTCLHYVAATGNVALANALIKADADCMPVDGEGTQPIHFGALCGHSEFVKTLIAAGVNINCTDATGRTPLIWSAGGGHPDLVEYLLGCGAEKNAMDEDRWTALDWATDGRPPEEDPAREGFDECIRLLQEAGTLQGWEVDRNNAVARASELGELKDGEGLAVNAAIRVQRWYRRHLFLTGRGEKILRGTLGAKKAEMFARARALRNGEPEPAAKVEEIPMATPRRRRSSINPVNAQMLMAIQEAEKTARKLEMEKMAIEEEKNAQQAEAEAEVEAARAKAEAAAAEKEAALQEAAAEKEAARAQAEAAAAEKEAALKEAEAEKEAARAEAEAAAAEKDAAIQKAEAEKDAALKEIEKQAEAAKEAAAAAAVEREKALEEMEAAKEAAKQAKQEREAAEVKAKEEAEKATAAARAEIEAQLRAEQEAEMEKMRATIAAETEARVRSELESTKTQEPAPSEGSAPPHATPAGGTAMKTSKGQGIFSSIKNLLSLRKSPAPENKSSGIPEEPVMAKKDVDDDTHLQATPKLPAVEQRATSLTTSASGARLAMADQVASTLANESGDLKDTFAWLDAGGRGRVTFREMSLALADKGLEISAKDVEQLFTPFLERGARGVSFGALKAFVRGAGVEDHTPQGKAQDIRTALRSRGATAAQVFQWIVADGSSTSASWSDVVVALSELGISTTEDEVKAEIAAYAKDPNVGVLTVRPLHAFLADTKPVDPVTTSSMCRLFVDRSGSSKETWNWLDRGSRGAVRWSDIVAALGSEGVHVSASDVQAEFAPFLPHSANGPPQSLTFRAFTAYLDSHHRRRERRAGAQAVKPSAKTSVASSSPAASPRGPRPPLHKTTKSDSKYTEASPKLPPVNTRARSKSEAVAHAYRPPQGSPRIRRNTVSGMGGRGHHDIPRYPVRGYDNIRSKLAAYLAEPLPVPANRHKRKTPAPVALPPMKWSGESSLSRKRNDLYLNGPSSPSPLVKREGASPRGDASARRVSDAELLRLGSQKQRVSHSRKSSGTWFGYDNSTNGSSMKQREAMARSYQRVLDHGVPGSPRGM